MEAAIRAVIQHEKGVNEASRRFHVTTTILRDRISGRVKHGSTICARPSLNKTEERTLKDFLFNASDVGLGKTRGHTMMYAEQVAKEKGYYAKTKLLTAGSKHSASATQMLPSEKVTLWLL